MTALAGINFSSSPASVRLFIGLFGWTGVGQRGRGLALGLVDCLEHAANFGSFALDVGGKILLASRRERLIAHPTGNGSAGNRRLNHADGHTQRLSQIAREVVGDGRKTRGGLRRRFAPLAACVRHRLVGDVNGHSEQTQQGVGGIFQLYSGFIWQSLDFSK